jgi:transposase InsO family protein
VSPGPLGPPARARRARVAFTAPFQIRHLEPEQSLPCLHRHHPALAAGDAWRAVAPDRGLAPQARPARAPLIVLPPAPVAHPATDRAVRARYPHHVWMLDLTEIPGFLRLFCFKLVVVLDVFSRMPLAARVFFAEPSGRDVARLFAATARRFGPPRHSVSDHGVQFTSRAFRRTLARLDVRHRYGAIGRTASIVIIERFFRTLKAITRLRARPPLLRRDLERRLTLAFDYYICLRPHQGLAGATPAEVHLARRPGHLDAVAPPRGRPGERTGIPPPPFEIRHLDPEHHLPYLVRKAA